MRRLAPWAALAFIPAGTLAADVPPQGEIAMPAEAQSTATGQFEVKLTPAPEANEGTGNFTLAKTFRGDLEGTSTGLMLSAGDPADGNAGYVAMERFTGTLSGRSGGFALQHSGTMEGAAQHLDIRIVPGSGDGDLAGIRGSMTIAIEGGVHSYVLTYELP